MSADGPAGPRGSGSAPALGSVHSGPRGTRTRTLPPPSGGLGGLLTGVFKASSYHSGSFSQTRHQVVMAEGTGAPRTHVSPRHLISDKRSEAPVPLIPFTMCPGTQTTDGRKATGGGVPAVAQWVKNLT